jgi:hypothetical protein
LSVRRSRAIPTRACPLAFLLLATGLLSACAHDYRPPGQTEPHALIKLRLTYHAWPGPLLEQSVAVDGDDLREIPAPTPQAAGGVAARQVLVRPGKIGCSVQATFFHNDITTHAETYETSEEAPCGASTCRQSRPHTRLVNRAERVDDATCTQGLRFPTERGESYLLEFDFQANQECTLKCHRLGRQAKGGPASLPCDDPARAHEKR